ncbi:DUF2510 domain-containing protein, partial [Mycobacterium sp. ACS1612]|uniref:DUF2510 domain-containing protein n=1 Tax=Mycobacterium sp. ACS1612 TaxID=1834117 RepID=UPI0012E9C2D7
MSIPPPAGWYPNPSGAPGQRYFDGHVWTAHHRPAPQQWDADRVAAGVAGIRVPVRPRRREE